MNHLHPVKTGLALGKVWAGLHVIWAALVAFGWAQATADFALWAHMVDVSYTVEAFNFGAAVTAVIASGLLGFVIGFTFAKVWNWLHQ